MYILKKRVIGALVVDEIIQNKKFPFSEKSLPCIA